METASITPVARIRINSLRIMDIKVDFGLDSFTFGDIGDSTGKPRRFTSCAKCSSRGFEKPHSHLEIALLDIPSILPSSSCVNPIPFCFCTIVFPSM